MQALVRTPDQHELVDTRNPRLKPPSHSDLPVAGLQESATHGGIYGAAQRGEID